MSDNRIATARALRVLMGSPQHAQALDHGHDPIGQQNEDIYQRMEALVTVLNVIAMELRDLQPTSQRTINLMRMMKNTATEVEMEIVTRRGR
jgi:hypothetical protein